MIRRIRPLLIVTVALAAALFARPALAGPPLLCFPFDIGSAHSLPMGHGSWRAIDERYDVSHLVGDTLALLAPATPVVVRMETLRRATLYAAAHPGVAAELLAQLQTRAGDSRTGVAALAAFDFGYLVETYKEAQFLFKAPLSAVDRIDGYQLVLKAHALQKDAIMQRAATLIAEGSPRGNK